MGRKVSLCKWQMFWMATCLICSFIFILFYTERKWLLMRNLVTIFLFKSKLSVNLQRFDAIDGSIENFQLKLKIVKQAQSFIRKIYRKLQAFTFKVIQECSSWESRKGAVQLFFLTPKKKKKKMLARKFLKWDRFGLCCRSMLFWMSSDLRFVKWLSFFERKYCKISDLFA